MRNKGIAMLAALFGASTMQEKHENIVKEEVSEEKKAELKKMAIRKRNKRNGLTEFGYGDKKLWALNRKSANRKAKKKGWL